MNCINFLHGILCDPLLWVFWFHDGVFCNLLFCLLYCNSLLIKQHKLQVLLVDQSDKFVFKPMLYELLSGGTSVSIV